MMEAYILHAPNRAVRIMKDEFVKVNGRSALEEFDRAFRDNWIQRSDIQNIARQGFNCVRVPFHYALVELRPGRYSRTGVGYLDRVVDWARTYGIYVILDLHAAPGSQNHDWHSDSLGPAEFWSTKSFQHRVFALWEFLADRYQQDSTVAGYDLLNEAVLKDNRKLNYFYKQAIKSIRGVDKNHVLFVEGGRWAQDLDCLDHFDDDQIVYSVHSYEPLNFTFNFVPQLKYPLKSKQGVYNKNTIKKLLSKYRAFADRRDTTIYVGEFGVHYREGLYNEDKWLADALSCFNDYGFHWTYWTYKAVKHHMFPDGVYSYYDNPPWVNRPGPIYGWHNYSRLWRSRKKDIVDSWRTKHFRVNEKVLKELKHAI